MNIKLCLLIFALLIFIVPGVYALSVYDLIRYIPEKSTPQCLVDCWNFYELSNPTINNIVFDEGSFWSEFRDKENLNLRSFKDVKGIKESHILREFRRILQTNTSVIDKESVCNIVSSIPNVTYSCTKPIYKIVQVNTTILDYVNVDLLNITLKPGEKVNITITGKKEPTANIDQVPVIYLKGITLKANKYAWWNGTGWNNRVCFNGLNNPNATIESRDNELFMINLSDVPGFGGCSNRTNTPCDEGRLLINDTATNFREVLFNVTNLSAWGNTYVYETATTTRLLFMLNTTNRYSPSNFNVTACLYYNNTGYSGGTSVNQVGTIVRSFDSFENSVGGWWTNSGMTYNNTHFREGKTGLMTTTGVTNIKDSNNILNYNTFVVYMYFNSAETHRGLGICPNNCVNNPLGTVSGAPSVGNLSVYNGGTLYNNQTNQSGWHTLKYTSLYSCGGFPCYFLNGKNIWASSGGALTHPWLGHAAVGSIQQGVFDVMVYSDWDLNMYDFSSNYSISSISISNIPAPAFECSLNTFYTNTTAIEHDSQVSWINFTVNATNVTGWDLTFFYADENYSGLRINYSITPNDTATNNVLAQAWFNASIVNVNNTQVRNNWTIICVLNNGSTRSISTSNHDQSILLAYVINNVSVTDVVPEFSWQNFTENISLFKSVAYVNSTLKLNLSSYLASILISSVTDSWNVTLLNVSALMPLVWNNATKNGWYFENVLVFKNGSIKLFNSSVQNTTILWSFIPEWGLPYVLDNLEGGIISLNSSLFKEQEGAIITGIFEYNDSNESANLIFNTSNRMSWQLNKSFGLMNIDSILSINFTGYWNISGLGINVIRNVTKQNFNIYRMYLTSCNSTLTSTKALNFTLKNELNGVWLNGSISLYFWTWGQNQGLNRSFGFSWLSNDTPKLCVYPSMLNMTVQGQAQYEAVGYPMRNNYFAPFVLSPPVSQAFDLLLLPVENATRITLNVINELSKGLINAIIRINRYDVATATETLVDTVTTGLGGSGASYIVLNKQYRFEVFYQNVLYVNQSFMVTETEYTFKLIVGNFTSLEGLMQVQGLSNIFSCDNTTRTASFFWNNTASSISLMCVKIVNMTKGGWNLIYSACSSNSSGNYSLGPYPLNNSLLVLGVAQQSNQKWVVGSCDLMTFQNEAVFGLEGLFWAILILLPIMAVGFFKVPIGIFLIVPWAFFVSITHLMSIGYSALVGIICVIGLLVMAGLRR